MNYWVPIEMRCERLLKGTEIRQGNIRNFPVAMPPARACLNDDIGLKRKLLHTIQRSAIEVHEKSADPNNVFPFPSFQIGLIDGDEYTGSFLVESLQILGVLLERAV